MINRKRLRVNSTLKGRLYCALLLFLTPVVLFAQNISGEVTDEFGAPLPGANVIVKDSNTGTTTDFDGKFNLDLPSGAKVLVVSFVGYFQQDIPINGKQSYIINLIEDVDKLDEVIVIGYGTSKKEDLTGSVASIDSKEFHNVPITSAEGLIANKMPGVQITPSSGRPGAGSNILIRGGSSLNASNDPLIVIDGVPLEGSGASNGPSVLSQLNPNDIENFTVLKDASAAAIYGSRASNGVIIITTKKGDIGDLKINVTSNTRVSQVVNFIDMLTADQYREVVNNLGGSATPVGDANTDWQREIFRLGIAADNNISASGAIKNIPYRASVSYLKQDGVVLSDAYERTTALLNISPKFFDNHLKVNLNLKGSIENQNVADTEVDAGNALYLGTNFDPTQPVYDYKHPEYGNYFQYTQFATNPALANINPVSILEQKIRRNKTRRAIANLQLDYKFHFLPELHFNVNAGIDMFRGTWREEVPITHFAEANAGGYIVDNNPSRDTENKLLEAYFFYSKDLEAIKSKLELTAGYSYNDFLTTNYFYPSYFANGTPNPISTPTFLFDEPSHALISFYGRLNYQFNDKYLLTASLRNDGSSRFPEDNRWGLFPAVAFAWKINQENFLKDSHVVTDLKLRLSYGVTGQQDGIANYAYIPGYSTGGLNTQYTFGNNRYFTVTPNAFNPNLKWEQTESSNLGLDFGFLNNRIAGSVDLYYKRTNDLLNTTVIPLGTNFAEELLLNIGSMENKGVEFNVNGYPVRTENFSWRIGVNVTFNEGKITKLANVDDGTVGLFSDATLVNTIGYQRNTFYLYKQVYDQDGKPLEGQMVDVNGDGQINADDRYITDKSATPKYLFGFNTNLNYKNWSLGAAGHANVGHYLFFKPADDASAITSWNTSQNLHSSYLFTRFQNNDGLQPFSDYYLQNASFFKLDNINLSYNFNEVFGHAEVGMNVNLSVQNVFTITDYTGRDPEASGGYENAYPIPRIYALGININF
ncbi:SusC/RagA family TonB-linked outer membrane protein [Pseudotamlana carrageenivorans]|uniref:SusC/RagA family protein n=1 Tax=Pseudotamlana carrageenivorans TaxID=2069432 RepID=A0A2I7SG70_9FLAO|nr:TonB-dependent receptor [Tamlana carrageenivorans]AUS04898.1 SusC/RagA family protein [Tamlana carrageenivorans]